MLLRLFFLFVVIPFIELTILLWLADATHWSWTLLLIVLTGMVGTVLVRWQGLQVVGRIREEMAAGRMPGQALADGVMVLLAGALLLTPGILTDLFGFSLLIPFCRAVYRKLLMDRIKVRVFGGGAAGEGSSSAEGPARDRIIDVEVREPDGE